MTDYFIDVYEIDMITTDFGNYNNLAFYFMRDLKM